MINNLFELKYDVLASLYWNPGDEKELKSRDFCKHLPLWFIQRILQMLEHDGLIIEKKDGVYKTLKNKARNELNERGYQVD